MIGIDILLYWLLFCKIIGILEYIIYSLEGNRSRDVVILWTRKILLSALKIIGTVIVASSFSIVQYNNEIFIVAGALYLMSSFPHKSVFFQLRGVIGKEKGFHILSHSINSILDIKGTRIIDLFAFARILMFLAGYAILFVSYY